MNPTIDQFWLIDYRIYDPDNDGKTKLEHAQEMLLGAVHHKQLSFQGVKHGHLVRYQESNVAD